MMLGAVELALPFGRPLGSVELALPFGRPPGSAELLGSSAFE